MANYTVVTDAVEEARLDYVLDFVNWVRGQEQLPPVTKAQLVQAMITDTTRGVGMLKQLLELASGQEMGAESGAYRATTEATRAQVRGLLGMPNRWSPAP